MQHHTWSAEVAPADEEADEEQAHQQNQFQTHNRHLLRGEKLNDLVLKTDSLTKASALFASSPKAYKRQKKMGVVFRGAAQGGNVFWGRRTVKEGESLGTWDVHGKYSVTPGPQRVWLFCARYRFMDRFTADQHQYLIIQHRDGTKEHVRGPTAMFMDPVKHVSVSVRNAVTVDAYEVITVYTEDKLGNVQRSIVRGPTVFVPKVNQWLHVFRWHGSKPDDVYTKVPGALVFTKLATIPDQLYYNAQGVRTSDDASLTVKVMVFFALTDLEVMLDKTHDPIADFINALLADLMNFGCRHSYESFIGAAQELSDLATFPVLTSRAAAIGYRVSKVVYRGYTATTALQDLCDRAIRTRMELRLKQEEQENAMRLTDMTLKASVARGAEERQQEATRAAHQLELKSAAAAAERAQQQAAAELSLSTQAATEKAAQAGKDAAAQSTLQYLAGLKELGVDLTPTLLAAIEPKPDKVFQLIGMGAGQPVALHAHLDQPSTSAGPVLRGR